MAEIAALTGLVQCMSLHVDHPLTSNGRWSSLDFVRRVGAWRAAFSATPGPRQALACEDSFEFAAALLGAWHAGKIVYLPADTLPSTLHSLASQVDGFAGEFAGALQPDPEACAPSMTWDDLDPEAIRLVLYTSGSSGDPEAIGKNLRQLDSEIATLESRFGTPMGDAHVQGTVSHQHIYGLLFRVLWPLAARRRFATHRLAYPEQIAALDAAQPIVLVSSPALLKRLPASLDWSSLRTSLRTAFSSGGPLPADAAAAVSRLWGQAAIEVFGSTETGGIATRSGGNGSWRLLPGVECRIDQSTLHVRSRHLADDQWFRTEDRARLAGDGFELLGRADRLVKLEERRISLDAIERPLRAHALVDEARVLLLAGARDRIAAVVVLSEDGRALLATAGRKAVIDRLRDLLHPQVDAIAVPRLWRFVEVLPANAQGKTTQKQLAELFLASRPIPQWQERSASSATLRVVPASELAVFDGHFPGTPIVPGVAMLDWAVAWGREAFDISIPFLRMEALKFQQLVRPEARLQLELGWKAETLTLHFNFQSAHGAHASGRIVFAAQGETA